MNGMLLNHFSRVCLYVTPWTAAYQAPLSMGFSRREYWENWLPGRAGTAYLVGPPRGIGHLVSETFSRRKELRAEAALVYCLWSFLASGAAPPQMQA